MIEIPSRTPTQLGNYHIAVPQHINIEVDMRDRRPRDVHLRDVRRQVRYHLGDRCDFERRADDNDQVNEVLVVVGETLREFIGEGFAEERDVRFHDPRSWDIVVFFRRVVGVGIKPTLPLVVTILRALALHSRWGAKGPEVGYASVAARDGPGFDIWEDGLARHLVFTLHTRGGCERPMALDKFFGKDARHRFDVVNVLRVVSQEFSLLLQQINESMSRRESVRRRQDIARN